MPGIVPRTKSLRGAKVDMGFPGSTLVKNWPADAGDERKVGSIPGQEEPLEEEMAAHSSILAWKIHGQRGLAGYSPWGRRRVRHNFTTKHHHQLFRVNNERLSNRPFL